MSQTTEFEQGMTELMADVDQQQEFNNWVEAMEQGNCQPQLKLVKVEARSSGGSLTNSIDKKFLHHVECYYGCVSGEYEISDGRFMACPHCNGSGRVSHDWRECDCVECQKSYFVSDRVDGDIMYRTSAYADAVEWAVAYANKNKRSADVYYGTYGENLFEADSASSELNHQAA